MTIIVGDKNKWMQTYRARVFQTKFTLTNSKWNIKRLYVVMAVNSPKHHPYLA